MAKSDINWTPIIIGAVALLGGTALGTFVLGPARIKHLQKNLAAKKKSDTKSLDSKKAA